MNDRLNFAKSKQDFSKSGILSLIQEITCWNQTNFIEFQFLAGNKHKALKDYLRGQSKDCNPETLQKKIENLTQYCYSDFKKAIDTNIIFANNYFLKSRPQPRMCLKLLAPGDLVIDIFRPIEMSNDTAMFHIKKNTGFYNIVKERRGLYYLCNNIPFEAKQGTYVNSRIDKEALKKYSPQSLSKWNIPSLASAAGLFSVKFTESDQQWVQCWYDYKHDLLGKCSPKDCYKSTLIVPITLKNSDGLCDDFTRVFFPDKPKDYRLIWGFFCFDYHHSDYFTEDDVAFGYIMADFLSLYLISWAIYTTFSSTFKEALERLNSLRSREN